MPRSVRRYRLRAGLAVTVAACFALTACGGGTEPASDQQASGTQSAAFPRTIQHAMGETVVETQPQTVAALDSSYVDAALALETKVVAFTEYPAEDAEQLPEYLPEADKQYGAEAVTVGQLATPDVEQLYNVAPDLIVSAKVRHEQIYNELSNVAPTVFSETTGATWKDNIRLLARALGKEQLAEQKISAYEQRARQVGENIKAKVGDDVTVTLARFTEGEPTVRLYTTASFPGIVLADAGLPRPQGQPNATDGISVDLSQEEIGKLDADRIFVGTYSNPSADDPNPKQQFMSNPLWGTLQGEISEIDDTSWITSVSLQGAHRILDDLAKEFGVDPARA